MGFLDFLRLGNKVSDIEEYFKKGAIIIDVRNFGEFKNGNITGSKNIPLNALNFEIEEIKSWNKPIITCCLSGIRSSQAASILKKNGVDCINGGGWSSLKGKLSSI